MTVQEIMERSGMKETTLAIAWIKDAIHLIQSQEDENVASWKTNITKNTREYPFPSNLIKVKSVGVKDTNDDKWKQIRRLTFSPTVTEDASP